MYDSDIQPSSFERAAGLRRKRHALLVAGLIAAGIIAVLFAAVAGRRPHQYRLVDMYPLYQDISRENPEMLRGFGIFPCRDGFCLREDEFVFVLRDWEKGDERWRIETPAPKVPVAARSLLSWQQAPSLAPAVSPDGQIFAAAVADGEKLRVLSWRAGTKIGEAVIPVPVPAGNGAQQVSALDACALNDGRCFAILAFGPLRHVFLIDGARVVAAWRGKQAVTLAPDGTTAVVGKMLAKISVEGAELRFTHIADLAGDTAWTPGTEGTAISEDCRLFPLPRQPVAGAGAWRLSTVSSSGRYAVIHNTALARTVDLTTGEAWEVDVPENCLGGDATEDGQHLLAHFAAGSLEEDESYNAYIALYQRPNRLLAWLEHDLTSTNSWWPSPDGRSIAMTGEEDCYLYRY